MYTDTLQLKDDELYKVGQRQIMYLLICNSWLLFLYPLLHWRGVTEDEASVGEGRVYIFTEEIAFYPRISRNILEQGLPMVIPPDSLQLITDTSHTQLFAMPGNRSTLSSYSSPSSMLNMEHKSYQRQLFVQFISYFMYCIVVTWQQSY